MNEIGPQTNKAHHAPKEKAVKDLKGKNPKVRELAPAAKSTIFFDDLPFPN
jgi:hypothetical protein